MFRTDDILFATLFTNRLQLRPLTITDCEAIFGVRSNDFVNQYLDRPACITSEDALLFIKNIQQDIIKQKCMYWAICFNRNNNLIGTICLFDFSADQQTAEIGFELLPPFQGKGYMQEALAAILTLGFEVLKIQTISAVAHIDNYPSIHLLEKNNFTRFPDAEGNTDTAYFSCTRIAFTKSLTR